MTDLITIAADRVEVAGFTFCPDSSYERGGRFFGFSVESADGTAMSGPAFETVVTPDDADLRVVPTPHKTSTVRVEVLTSHGAAALGCGAVAPISVQIDAELFPQWLGRMARLVKVSVA